MSSDQQAWLEQAFDDTNTERKFHRDRAEALEKERDSAYRERAHLIALLAAMFPAAWTIDPDNIDPDNAWPIVYIQLPTGQCSWHIAHEDWTELFVNLDLDYGGMTWDGHTTEQKYQRIRDYTAQFAADVALLPEPQPWPGFGKDHPIDFEKITRPFRQPLPPTPTFLITTEDTLSEADAEQLRADAQATPRPAEPLCLYQCPDHHGVNAHTIDCPVHSDRHVCAGCSAEITRQEIAADPYYRGDYYAMYGDDE